MYYIKEKSPFEIRWHINIVNSSVSLADAKLLLVLKTVRGNYDITDYIEDIVDNIIRVKLASLTFVGDYSLYLKIQSDSFEEVSLLERFAFRVVKDNDPSVIVDVVELSSDIYVKSYAYDSALSSGSTNAVQNAVLTEALADKQETINDLEDIRSGANKGATALQEIPEEYVTAEELSLALDAKVDKESGKGLSSNDYTTTEKKKLASLENYDDSSLRIELNKKANYHDIPTRISQLENDTRYLTDIPATYVTDTELAYALVNKAEKSEIPTKMSQLEQDIEIGSDYDDTEIKQELTELSAEVSGLSEKIDNLPSGGGASSDKQGVVSQTLNYNSADNTYSVSNVVRGSIPSFFIDLVTEAGASFNAESGYFSLNGIDNIAYDEMKQIYNCRTGYGVNSLLAVYGNTYTARTNFAAFRGFGVSYANHQPTTFYTKYLCCRNASITKFVIHNEGISLCVRADCVNNFEAFGTSAEPILRSRLEEIIGIIDVTNLANSANFFYNGTYQPWLTSFQLKSLKASIDLSGMPRLSEATILYMINNEKAASAITIKLHADAKAMADASEAIQSALSNHANITLGV